MYRSSSSLPDTVCGSPHPGEVLLLLPTLHLEKGKLICIGRRLHTLTPCVEVLTLQGCHWSPEKNPAKKQEFPDGFPAFLHLIFIKCRWFSSLSSLNLEIWSSEILQNERFTFFNIFRHVFDIFQHFRHFPTFRHYSQIFRTFSTFDIFRHFSTFFNIFQHFSTRFRHYSTLFNIFRLFDIIRNFSTFRHISTFFNIFQHFSTFFDTFSTFSDIFRHFSTLFDIIRHFSTFNIMSKNVENVEICRGTVS